MQFALEQQVQAPAHGVEPLFLHPRVDAVAEHDPLAFSLRIGIPQGGWRTPEGILCENNQLEPDILVRNDPDVLALGRDQQIEAAVKELLRK